MDVNNPLKMYLLTHTQQDIDHGYKLAYGTMDPAISS